MKYHCFFEQSGTFKNEFKKLGYDSFDYDILNDFGETDYLIDLFKEINNAYDSKSSIFDNFTKEDFIKLLGRFYSKDEIEKYGVVAIIFRKD